jgi:hypothetical protein
VEKILWCGNHTVSESSVRPLIHGFINSIAFSKVRLLEITDYAALVARY